MSNFNIKLGDCLELLQKLPDGCVDLTVTSPPYDNLRTYNGNVDRWNFEKFQAIAQELYRVTKNGGVVVWIVADATIKGSETGTSFRQALWFMECGFRLHDTMIWAKPGITFPDKIRYYQSFEYMFVFGKGKLKTANLITDRKNRFACKSVHGTNRLRDGTTVPKSASKKGNGRVVKNYGVRFNVWNAPAVQSSKERTGHPAQFPEALAHDHIVSWSNPGDTVLDPFMGSGTTGAVCAMTDRHFVGFEIDEEYFAIAVRRINRAHRAKVVPEC